MVTTVTSTISLSGTPDYSTLQAWEDDAPADLVAADQIWKGVIQEPTDNFTARLTVSGSTTDATRYKELTVKDGASFIDHADAATNPLRFDNSKGASITIATSVHAILNNSESHFHLSRLQMASTAAARIGAVLALNTNGAIVEQCLVEGETDAAQILNLEGASSSISNSLIVQRASSANFIINLTNSSQAVNCTFVVPNDITAAVNALALSGTPILTNCAIFGASSLGGTIAATACYTDLSSPPSGFTQVAYDETTGSGFQDIDDATRDFRIKNTSSLLNAGLTDALGTPDILDTARPIGGAYDVGCFEFPDLITSGGTNLFINDSTKSFLVANAFPPGWNDGMLAFLRQFFGVSGSSLTDLLARYIRENGRNLP